MFYTNVERYKNEILFRGYTAQGESVERRVKYKPSFFVPAKKRTKWKALDGTPVDIMTFPSMWEASQFVKRYDGVVGFKWYGTTNYVHQFLTEGFPSDIKFNRADLSVTALDIEVTSGKRKYSRNHKVKVRKK